MILKLFKDALLLEKGRMHALNRVDGFRSKVIILQSYKLHDSKSALFHVIV
jgi:hypothetical protein